MTDALFLERRRTGGFLNPAVFLSRNLFWRRSTTMMDVTVGHPSSLRGTFP